MIFPGCIYYLVPTPWLTKWRAYLGAAGKNVLAVDEPVGLEGFILSLLCQKVNVFSFCEVLLQFKALLSSGVQFLVIVREVLEEADRHLYRTTSLDFTKEGMAVEVEVFTHYSAMIHELLEL